MPPVKYGGRGGLKSFCSERCRVRVYRRERAGYAERERDASRRRARAKSAEREAALPPKPRCGHCGGEMSSRRKDARYCNGAECQRVSKAEMIKRNRPCSVDGCERGVLARGYCPSHYKSEYHVPKFGATKRKPVARTCVCGVVVFSVQGRAKYCSDMCRYAWRDVVRSESRDVVLWEPPLHIPVVRMPRVTVLPPKQSRRFGCVCVVCGVAFVADGMHRTCSKACRRERVSESVDRARRKYAASRGGFAPSASFRLAICERDGWHCQLCGVETSRVYSPTDPLSPTLDHIQPQSLSEVPDHSVANLRLACAMCNSRRSNNVDWVPDVVLIA